eukprot:gene10861-11015_t
MDDSGQRTKPVSSAANSFVFTNLPEGVSLVYACGKDPQGAEACESLAVTVKPPPHDYDIQAAVSQLDVQQLAGTNDVTALCGGAGKLSNLVSGTSTGSTGRRLLQAAATTDASFKANVLSKASQLLMELSSLSSDLTSDAMSLQQVVSAAEQLPHAGLSRESLAQVLSIALGAINSIQLADWAINSFYANQLLALVALGLDAQTQGLCLVPETCSPGTPGRSLLQALPDGQPFNTAVQPVDGPTASAVIYSLNNIANSLAGSRAPGSGFISAGRDGDGLFVSVARELGSSYAGFVMAVGPDATSRAGDLKANINSISMNSVLTFKGSLAAGFCNEPPCSGEAVTLIAQLVQLPNKLITAPVASYISVPPLQGLELLTPAVRLLAAGAADESLSSSTSTTIWQPLPCAVHGGCNMIVSLPLQALPDSRNKQLVCLRVLDGVLHLLPDSAWQAKLISSSDRPEAVECALDMQATVIVGQINPTSQPSPPPPPPPPPPEGNTNGSSGGSGSGGISNDTAPAPPPASSPSPPASSPSPPASSPSPPAVTQHEGASFLECPVGSKDAAGWGTVPLLTAKLMSAGGLAKCQGMYRNLVTPSSAAQEVVTDDMGKFTLQNAQLGSYSFNGGGTCVDLLTNKSVWHPHFVVLPPKQQLVITELLLLSVPAALDAQASDQTSSSSSPNSLLGDRCVISQVFEAFGFNESQLQVDLLTFENITASQATFTAFYGKNIQLASVFAAISQALEPLTVPQTMSATRRRQLMAGPAGGQSLQQQLAAQLWNAVTSSCNATAAITDEAMLLAMTNQTYQALIAQNIPAVSFTNSQLATVFRAVAAVVSETNSKVQVIMAQALATSASSQNTSSDLSALASLATLAAVQQGAVVSAIASLSAELAANPNMDAAQLDQKAVQLMQNLTGPALDALIANSTVSVDQLKDSLGSSGILIEEPGTAPSTSLAWVAGPVIGGVACMVGAILLALHLLKTRRAATAGFDAAGRYAVKNDDAAQVDPDEVAVATEDTPRANAQHKPDKCKKAARTGDTVTVHYTGKLTDGKQFDSSHEEGEPFSFTLGEGEVIKGWDQGLVGMCVGEKRILRIPPELGYGDSDTGGVIPAGSTLIFDVELMSLNGDDGEEDEYEDLEDGDDDSEL